MPELPEVENVCRMLRFHILNKKIKDVNVIYSKVIDYPDYKEFIQEAKGQTILEVNRRGKWIIMKLSEDTILSHLRMEGKYFVEPKKRPYNKHDLLAFQFEDGFELVYNDTRKFGRLLLFNDIDAEKYLDNRLGPEPGENALTVSYLKNKLKGKSIAIKTALLDQSIVSGLGNIYVNEVLFEAKVNPKRKAKDVTKKELKVIIEYAKEIFDLSIESGGTTIRTFAAGHEPGKFQEHLKVHFREGEVCKVCDTPIKKEKVYGRGTYYCPKCQKK